MKRRGDLEKVNKRDIGIYRVKCRYWIISAIHLYIDVLSVTDDEAYSELRLGWDEIGVLWCPMSSWTAE